MDGGDLVVVGRLGRPHGVGGEIRAHPTGATLQELRPGDTLVAEGGTRREVVLRRLRAGGSSLIVSFAGIESREAVAALTGATLAVPSGRLAALVEPDAFYVRDLIGCTVVAGALVIGTVRDVHDGPANDALEVERDGSVTLVPFTRDAVVSVDLPRRTVEIRLDVLPDSEEPPS